MFLSRERSQRNACLAQREKEREFLLEPLRNAYRLIIFIYIYIYIYILGFASNRKTYGFFRLVQSMQSFSQYAVAKPQINSEL